MERRAGIWRLVLGNANKAILLLLFLLLLLLLLLLLVLSRVALAIGGAKPGSRFLSRTGVKKWESRVSFLILKIS